MRYRNSTSGNETLKNTTDLSETTNITFEVTRVNWKGMFIVEFSEFMRDEPSGFNRSIANNESLRIEVQHYLERVIPNKEVDWNLTDPELYPVAGDNRHHNLAWRMVSFLNKKMTFQLYFKQPLMVSLTMDETKRADLLKFEILKPEYFKARLTDHSRIDRKERYKTAPVSKQLLNNTLTHLLTSQAQNLKTGTGSIVLT